MNHINVSAHHFYKWVCSVLCGSLLLGFWNLTQASNAKPFQENSLQKLFTLALENSPVIQLSIEQQKTARENKEVAASLLQPDVRLQSELSYSWMQMNAFARTASQVQASYPLYHPDREDLHSLASHQYREKKWQLESSKQALLLKVSNLYFDFWEQKSEHVFLQKEFDAISEIMAQVQQQLTLGYRDLNDISEIQARLDQNRANLIQVEQRLHTIQIDFELLLGTSINLEPFFQSEDLLSNIHFSYDKSLIQNHPSIKRYEEALLASSKKIAYEKNKDGLIVKVFGAVINNQSDGYFYDDAQGAKLGLKLDVPLYLGGQTQASIAKARAERGQILAQKRQQELILTASFKRATEQLKYNQKNILALKEVLASNKQALEAAENGLSTGNRNILDLLNVQRRLYRAERDIQIAMTRLSRNWYLRLWSLGQLQPEF